MSGRFVTDRVKLGFPRIRSANLIHETSKKFLGRKRPIKRHRKGGGKQFLVLTSHTSTKPPRRQLLSFWPPPLPAGSRRPAPTFKPLHLWCFHSYSPRHQSNAPSQYSTSSPSTNLALPAPSDPADSAQTQSSLFLPGDLCCDHRWRSPGQVLCRAWQRSTAKSAFLGSYGSGVAGSLSSLCILRSRSAWFLEIWRSIASGIILLRMSTSSRPSLKRKCSCLFICSIVDGSTCSKIMQNHLILLNCWTGWLDNFTSQ